MTYCYIRTITARHGSKGRLLLWLGLCKWQNINGWLKCYTILFKNTKLFKARWCMIQQCEKVKKINKSNSQVSCSLQCFFLCFVFFVSSIGKTDRDGGSESGRFPLLLRCPTEVFLRSENYYLPDLQIWSVEKCYTHTHTHIHTYIHIYIYIYMHALYYIKCMS